MYDDSSVDSYSPYNEHSTRPSSAEEIIHNCRIISNIAECSELIEVLLKNYKLVALDMKGYYIDKGGPISVLILATSDGCIFIFDLYISEHLMYNGRLKELIESKDVVKVIHGSQKFKIIMQNFYNTFPKDIFDTQVAFKLLQSKEHGYDMNVIEDEPLSSLVANFGRNMNVTSDQEFRQMLNRKTNLWEYRPLNIRGVEMAARNVVCLLPEVYANLDRLIPKEYFKELSTLMNPLPENPKLIDYHNDGKHSNGNEFEYEMDDSSMDDNDYSFPDDYLEPRHFPRNSRNSNDHRHYKLVSNPEAGTDDNETEDINAEGSATSVLLDSAIPMSHRSLSPLVFGLKLTKKNAIIPSSLQQTRKNSGNYKNDDVATH